MGGNKEKNAFPGQEIRSAAFRCASLFYPPVGTSIFFLFFPFFLFAFIFWENYSEKLKNIPQS